MEQQVRRLVTRSDFDGLACAMMLKELGLVDEIKFVHPKDVQDGKIELSKNDITTNLPYDPRVSIAFDHHESEVDRLKATETNGKLIIDPNARSAARVVYDYYGGKEAFPRISDELMAAVDKGQRGLYRGRDSQSHGLGAAALSDGCPHRPRPLPSFPHLELRPDDGAD